MTLHLIVDSNTELGRMKYWAAALCLGARSSISLACTGRYVSGSLLHARIVRLASSFASHRSCWIHYLLSEGHRKDPSCSMTF